MRGDDPRGGGYPGFSSVLGFAAEKLTGREPQRGIRRGCPHLLHLLYAFNSSGVIVPGFSYHSNVLFAKCLTALL